VPGEPAAVAEYLRQQGITIICRPDTCILDTDTEIVQPILIDV
jgi:hypothetical protein